MLLWMINKVSSSGPMCPKIALLEFAPYRPAPGVHALLTLASVTPE